MSDAHEGRTKRYAILIDPDKVEAVIAITKARLLPPESGAPFDEDELFRQFVAEALNAELFRGEVLKYWQLTWRGYTRGASCYPLGLNFAVRDDGGDVICGAHIIGELRVTWMDYRAFDPVNDRAVPPGMLDDEFEPEDVSTEYEHG